MAFAQSLELICGLVYLGFAGMLVARWQGRPTGLLLAGVCAATGLWALAGVARGTSSIPDGWGHPTETGLDFIRLGGWLAFLVAVVSNASETRLPLRRLFWITLAASSAAFVLIGVDLYTQPNGPTATAGVVSRLMLATTGLALLEILVRMATPETRFAIKHLCVGLAGLFVFEVVVWSEALLLAKTDPLLAEGRSLVALVVTPLIAVSVARNESWSVDLYATRRAVFQSVALTAVGLYMLGLAALGSWLRLYGGDLAGPLRIPLFFGGALFLVLLLLSESLRSFLRRQISRAFFQGKYDYREVWGSFVDAMSRTGAREGLAVRALRAIAGPLDVTSARLFMLEDGEFRTQASIGLDQGWPEVVSDDPFTADIARGEWELVELEALGQKEPRQLAERIPSWVRDAWLLVPLTLRDDLLGFIVMTRPRISRELDDDDRDLLRIEVAQVASYLAEERAGRALEEARRFLEISKRTSFVAHDLRNVANDLTLALANAKRHIDSPEFQRDLLLSMEDSIRSLDRLLDRIGRGGVESNGTQAVDLVKLLSSSIQVRLSDRPRVTFESNEESEMFVLGDPDDLRAIVGHLIRNAAHAATLEGHVQVTLRRHAGGALIVISDDGPGMRPEVADEHLRRPFRSDKASGYGLGLYECRKIAEKLGGELAIDSALEQGTRVSVTLPLALPAVEGGGRGIAR